MTREQIWRQATRISGASRKTDEALAVAILLASLVVGPDERKCAAFLGRPYDAVACIGANLRVQGIWTRDRICHSGWDDKETGGIALLLDACVGLGLVERALAGGDDA